MADSRKKKLSKFEFPVQIQNNELIGYRDTGSPRTFVRSNLFPDVAISGEMKIWGINDVDPVTIPTCLLEISSDYFHPRKVITVEAGLLPHMVWDCLLGNDLFEGTAINDVIGNTDSFLAVDASCAKAQMSDLCLTDTDDSNPDARRDDVSASAQRQVAPSEVISREPRGQVTYLSRSISSDGSLQCDSAHPHGESGLTGLTDRQTAASLDSDVTSLQVAMSRPSVIDKCQTHITSADCNAVMSTRPCDTDRYDMNSSTSLTSSEHPLAQLSESESDDGRTEHINPPTDCDSEFRRLANICAADMDTNSDNLSDSGRLFKKAQENDPTLKHWRNLAELGSKTFILQDGILWKRQVR